MAHLYSQDLFNNLWEEMQLVDSVSSVMTDKLILILRLNNKAALLLNCICIKGLH